MVPAPALPIKTVEPTHLDETSPRFKLTRWFWGLVILLLLTWLIVAVRRWSGQWVGTPGPTAVVLFTWTILVVLSALNRVPLDVWSGTPAARLMSLIPLAIATLWGLLLGWSHEAFACGVAVAGAIIASQIVRLCLSQYLGHPTFGQPGRSDSLGWDRFAEWCNQPSIRLAGITSGHPVRFVPAESAKNTADGEPVLVTQSEETDRTSATLPTSPGDRMLGESWQVRRVEAGSTVIEGETAIVFAAGLRDAWLHLVFEPALPIPMVGHSPQLELEPVEGEDLELKVDAVFPYGARVLARRQLPTDGPLSVRLAYLATSRTGIDSESDHAAELA